MTGSALSGEVVDGGDRACGELLLVLAARARGLPPGTVIRLLASDPAAAVDLPAWCYLTGHDFLGFGDAAGRRYYDLRTSATARDTHHAHPWRLATDPPAPRASPPAPDERNHP